MHPGRAGRLLACTLHAIVWACVFSQPGCGGNGASSGVTGGNNADGGGATGEGGVESEVGAPSEGGATGGGDDAPDDAIGSESSDGSGPGDSSAADGAPPGDGSTADARTNPPGNWAMVQSPAIYVATNGNDTSGDGSIGAPYLTLEKAQTVARGGSVKVVYLRAGVYMRTAALSLGGADDGETWSGYPGDPVDSATLDDSGMSFTGGTTYAGLPTNSQITINGASNVTIDGLELRYSPGAGVFVQGGSGNTITNCSIHDNNGGGPPFNMGDGQNAAGIYSTWYAGIESDGTTSFTISHNYVYNMMVSGIVVTTSHSNLTIDANFVDACNLAGEDSGGIYVQDVNSVSTNVRVSDNFIRDAGGRDVGGYYSGHTYTGGPKTNPGSNNTHAMYSDDGSIDVSWTGNIVSGNVATAAIFHDTKNVVYTGNIIDMGNPSTWVFWNQSDVTNGGNIWNGNIIISNYTGTAVVDAYTSLKGTNGTTAPMASLADNVYYNYAGGTVNYAGDGNPTASDSNPVLEDPQLDGWDYEIAAGSPVFGAPVAFPAITGGWGPPGFTVPQWGTPPSCPH